MDDEKEKFEKEIEDGEVDRFSSFHFLNEENYEGLKKWIVNDRLVGLVDKACIGMIGYLKDSHAERIIKKLNGESIKVISNGVLIGDNKSEDKPYIVYREGSLVKFALIEIETDATYLSDVEASAKALENYLDTCKD